MVGEFLFWLSAELDKSGSFGPGSLRCGVTMLKTISQWELPRFRTWQCQLLNMITCTPTERSRGQDVLGALLLHYLRNQIPAPVIFFQVLINGTKMPRMSTISLLFIPRKRICFCGVLFCLSVCQVCISSVHLRRFGLLDMLECLFDHLGLGTRTGMWRKLKIQAHITVRVTYVCWQSIYS